MREVTLVTTLLDDQRYSAQEIGDLYRLRWQVEVDLRNLKITLGLDVLKGRKVETVRKEALVCVLVYNLVRLVMLKAARRQRVRANRRRSSPRKAVRSWSGPGGRGGRSTRRRCCPGSAGVKWRRSNGEILMGSILMIRGCGCEPWLRRPGAAMSYR